MVVLLLLALGVMEVALALYARNVVAASAHEGARAAVELGRTPADAVSVATHTVRAAAGGLVDDLEVGARFAVVQRRVVVRVEVSGILRPFGPVPLPIPVAVGATASRDVIP
jgi:TadE-like protein